MIDAKQHLQFLTCPICQDIFTAPVVQCPSGHAFCETVKKTTTSLISSQCAHEWLSRKRSCPSCRCDLNPTTLSRNLLVEQALEELSVGRLTVFLRILRPVAYFRQN